MGVGDNPRDGWIAMNSPKLLSLYLEDSLVES